MRLGILLGNSDCSAETGSEGWDGLNSCCGMLWPYHACSSRLDQQHEQGPPCHQVIDTILKDLSILSDDAIPFLGGLGLLQSGTNLGSGLLEGGQQAVQQFQFQ